MLLNLAARVVSNPNPNIINGKSRDEKPICINFKRIIIIFILFLNPILTVDVTKNLRI